MTNVVNALQRLANTEPIEIDTPLTKGKLAYPITEKDYKALEPYMNCMRTTTYEFASGETISMTIDSRTVDYSHLLYNGQNYLLLHTHLHNLFELIQAMVDYETKFDPR